MMTQLAATTFAVLTALAVLFQGALMLGAPWGALTMGGKYPGRLPPAVRVVPALSIALLTGFAGVVLSHAKLAFHGLAARSNLLIWVVVAYCVVGALANFMTPSRRERAVWLPVVTVMLGCALLVALR